MRFVHLELQNWRNFRKLDIPLQRRVFLVGPNASGKSNLLDALRFLRDIADPQGGLQRAVEDSRGGVSHIRSLHARENPNVAIQVRMELGEGPEWTYRLEFSQDNQRRPVVKKEEVLHGEKIIRSRPDEEDKADPSRLTQTHLEQVNANKPFREVATFLAQIRYMHLVPQLVREPERSPKRTRDPYGSDFLDQLARTPKKTLDSRLNRIREALRVAVPKLKELKLDRDKTGIAHLYGLYEHWRPNAGWQTEDEFSDGTLRLLGLLWVFLDGTAPLLLEEPELSLHAAVVRHLPSMMARLGRKFGRQILVSTHSADILAEQGIAPEEVICLEPTNNGTRAFVATDDSQIKALLEGGVSMAEAVLPRTAPTTAANLSLFAE
jgi:predicted ATPase